ncbi:hypothetical protein GGS20DRAFT_456373 [Poronia punctata]|nr:hypothetical protein GGS20DRAFT_456373 [Poronia punctata]
MALWADWLAILAPSQGTTLAVIAIELSVRLIGRVACGFLDYRDSGMFCKAAATLNLIVVIRLKMAPIKGLHLNS